MIQHSLLRRLMHTDFERLLEALTTRQHLAPHESVARSLATTVDDMGVCPNAIERTIQWLALDPNQAVGRLRRTELMQLARTVHRYWRQRPSRSASERQPQ